MAVVRKKQDDKYLKALRELVTTGAGNRQCFDCGQKGPTYVNMTIGSFVCTRCSGVLRGLTPPHRVKSISMATFTQEEIDFLKVHGNDSCAKTWLGLWDPKRVVHQDQRELMIDKYERKRYYLEPASPLKSLTNAASLKATNSNSSSSAAAGAAAATATSTQSNGNGSDNTNNNHSNSNGYSHLTNGFGHKKNSIDHSFKNIQLTPPTSQRSRPQHQHNGYHQDAFMVNHGLNGLNGLSGLNGLKNSSVGSASTGALSDTSSCASNGFGPDADFVADFGSANIFDATSASSVGSPAVSSASSVASSNGYAKIQPIKTAQQQFMNGHTKAMPNGNAGEQFENFADFDHAPIFNAAGLPIPNGISKHSTAMSANSLNNNKLGTTPNEDRYAALKDLDEQLRESKAVAAAAASIVASGVVDSFGNNNNHNNNNGVNNVNGANPFNSQQQQQQQQSAGGAVVNPFQAAHNTAQQNLYGQMTVIPNGIVTNGFATQQHTPPTQQQQPTAGAYYGYSNGFAPAAAGGGGIANGSLYPTALGGGPGGCGFGFGSMQQQIAATGGLGGGGFSNPFAATGVSNSNNPFL